MKTIVKISTSLLMLLSITLVNAQTVPTVPSPPPTPSTTTNSSSSSSYSISISDDDKQGGKTNVSILVSNSDDSYSLNAKFPKEKYREVKSLLIKELNQSNMTTSNGKYRWVSKSGNEEVYSVNLNEKRLSMSLDKDIASLSLQEKFETLGTTVRNIIVGEENDAKREAERLQREADRMRRSAERMQREADRMQREAERQAKNVAKQYEEDAQRIADEAMRLAEEASELNTEASHKGAVSSLIKKLLKEDKTYLESTNGSNWNWPKAQKEVITQLVNDGFVSSSSSDVNFINDETGTYVNGRKFSSQQVKSYKTILANHEIPRACDFSLYRSGNNIVIVGSNAQLEDAIKDLANNGYISSVNKKVKLNINGNTAFKDGKQLNTVELSAINKILLANNIIPSPGKILEIMKPGAYKVGYSVNGKTHLGTWSVIN